MPNLDLPSPSRLAPSLLALALLLPLLLPLGACKLAAPEVAAIVAGASRILSLLGSQRRKRLAAGSAR